MLLALETINIFGKELARIYLTEHHKFNYLDLRYEFYDDLSQLDIVAMSSKRNSDDWTINVLTADPIFKEYSDPFTVARYYALNLIERERIAKQKQKDEETEKRKRIKEIEDQQKLNNYKALQKELSEKGLI